jgi:hypothetical protein
MFLKLKEQASGYPSFVQSEEHKDKYIEDYRHAEGIALDKASTFKNLGQRTLAKLKLNWLWGRLPRADSLAHGLAGSPRNAGQTAAQDASPAASSVHSAQLHRPTIQEP